MYRLLAGFIAGITATLPMTAVMFVLNKLLVSGDYRSLPPYEITMRTSDKAGFWHKLMDKEERSGIATAAHFVFGGLAGIPYSLAVSLIDLPGMVTGVLYGILFWAVNYLNLLPMLGLYPDQKNEDHSGRTATTIFSHLVWGATLGAMIKKLAVGRNTGFKVVDP